MIWLLLEIAWADFFELWGPDHPRPKISSPVTATDLATHIKNKAQLTQSPFNF